MDKKRKQTPAMIIVELSFVAWLLVINILYYSQFRDLFFSHLPAWLRR